VCSNCRKEYFRSYRKLWGKNNKEKRGGYAREYRKRHREQIKVRVALKYLRLDKNKIRKQQRDLYAKNKERYREKASKWRKGNLDKVRLWNLNRYIKMKGIKREGRHIDREWQKLKKLYRFTCVDCNKKEPSIKLTRDHVIPLSKWNNYIKQHVEIIYGYNDIENILPRCLSCNSSKKDKIYDTGN